MKPNYINIFSATELLGMSFCIRDYQYSCQLKRNNILQLLNDIWEYRIERNNINTFYYLQPIVVHKTQWQDINNNTIEGYELIKGQERLITLHRIITFLILEYLYSDLITEGYPDNLFSLYYKPGLETRAFLEKNVCAETKPDLLNMIEVYHCIKHWFEDGKKGNSRFLKAAMLEILLPVIIKKDNGEKKFQEWSVQVLLHEI